MNLFHRCFVLPFSSCDNLLAERCKKTPNQNQTKPPQNSTETVHSKEIKQEHVTRE